jgi:hypothetical protein
VGGDGQGVAGVVVQPGQDLHVGAVVELVVGEVGLPALIGLLGGEADVGGSGPLAGRWDHQTLAVQGAIDRRSGHPKLMMVFEVPGDRVSPGIQPLSRQLPAQLNDQRDRRVGDRRG